MILSLLLALIAGLSMLWIVRPLIGLAGGQLADDHAARADSLKAALAALEVDRAQATMPEAEAQAERAVLARALLTETEAVPDAPRRMLPRWSGYAMAVALPIFGLLIYMNTGVSGGRSSLSAYNERVTTEKIQRQLADILKTRPNDPKGHKYMAMTEASLGHYGEAARHYADAIALGADTAENYVLYGEILAFDAGKPTAEALSAFDEALKREPDNLRARTDRAEARYGLGDFKGEQEDLETALALLPGDSPVLPALKARIEEAQRMQKGQAIASANPESQTAMIQGMVEGLAQRLEQTPKDLSGWTRLIHAYAVLGQKDKARTALGRAKQIFAADASAKPALDQAARELD